MPYLILAFDHDEKSEHREKLKDPHRAHQMSVGRELLVSGVLLSDDGSEIIGELTLLDTEEPDIAKLFAQKDPYAMAGIRKETKMIRWNRRWIDGKFVGESQPKN